MTPKERYTQWLVALGAIHAEQRGGGRFDALGGFDNTNERYPEMREALKEEFGVTTKKGAAAWLAKNVNRTSVVDPAIFKGSRLFERHEDELLRVGFLAWQAHRFVRFASLARTFLGSDTLSWVAVMGARVRSSYDSWRSYGFHVLLGDAAQDGIWDTELERAYVRLVEWDGSPWRRIPWDAYPVERGGRVPVAVRVHIRCPHCSDWVALDRLADRVLCASCLSAMTVPAEVWRALGEGLEETRRWPAGYEETESTYDVEVELALELGVSWPTCARGHTMTDAALASGADRGEAKCSTCDERVHVRKPDALISRVAPGALYVAGETEASVVRDRGPGSIAFCCEQCGAPLAADGRTRNTPCTYCKHDNRLPDDLWARLRPASIGARLTLVFEPPA